MRIKVARQNQSNKILSDHIDTLFLFVGNSLYADLFTCNFPFYRVILEEYCINIFLTGKIDVKITYFTLRQMPITSVRCLLLCRSFGTHTKTRDDKIPHKG